MFALASNKQNDFAAKDNEKALRAGGATDYQPQKPWEWVWNQLVQEQEFWHREVEEPCILLLAKTQNLNALVGDDAVVDVGGGRHTASVKRLKYLRRLRLPHRPNVREGPTSESTSWVRTACFHTTGKEWNYAGCFRQVNAQKQIVVVVASSIHRGDISVPSA